MERYVVDPECSTLLSCLGGSVGRETVLKAGGRGFEEVAGLNPT